jgi:hypothetical protein
MSFNSQNGLLFLKLSSLSFISEVELAIKSIANSHPSYTLEQFKADFRSMLNEEPTFFQMLAFNEAVAARNAGFTLLVSVPFLNFWTLLHL